MVAQLLALLRSRFLQGTGRQPLRRGISHLLHLGQVHVQTGALLAKSSANHDFSPLFRELTNGLQILGRQLPCCHSITVLGFRKIRQGEFPLPILPNSLCGAKGVLHSVDAFPDQSPMK
jgi:hypothetical protein